MRVSSYKNNLKLFLYEKENFFCKKKFSEAVGGLDNHHIIPLASGGTDQPYNIVRLSKADHIIGHCYLAKVSNKSTDHYAVRMFKLKA
jgi:hypothetical protein